jgi:hypothetical protein
MFSELFQEQTDALSAQPMPRRVSLVPTVMNAYQFRLFIENGSARMAPIRPTVVLQWSQA